MELSKHAGFWAPWIGLALWILFLVNWFAICPLVDVSHPPKFEPGAFCRLNSIGWFAALLLLPLFAGGVGFRHMRMAMRVVFSLVVALPLVVLLLRWAYITYAP